LDGGIRGGSKYVSLEVTLRPLDWVSNKVGLKIENRAHSAENWNEADYGPFERDFGIVEANGHGHEFEVDFNDNFHIPDHDSNLVVDFGFYCFKAAE